MVISFEVYQDLGAGDDDINSQTVETGIFEQIDQPRRRP
jgi:hypothetical protein